MRKIVILIVIAFATFTITACSKDSNDVSVLKHLAQFNTFDPNEDPNVAIIERLTEQKVEYYMLPQTNTDEKLYLDIAGGADYNSMTLYPHQFNKLYSAGALLDLTDLIDKHGPNIKEAISDVSWKTATFDGKIYGIPHKNPSPNLNFSFFVRMDVLKANGVTTVPVTLDDFKTTLTTLKNNGVTVPFCADGFSVDPIRGAFGLATEWVVQTDGTLKHWTQTNEFESYINYIKDLNTNGLLQANFLTETTNCKQLFTTGEAAFISSAWWVGNTVYSGIASSIGITVDDLLADIDNYIQYIPSLEGANGMKQIKLDRSITYFIAIPKYMKDEAVATIKWINEKLDKDNFREIAIGVENETYKIIDGKYYPILEPLDENGKTPFDTKNKADYFLTGSREDDYAQYWQARARKLPTQQHSWESMNAEPLKWDIGVYDPIGLAPGFTVWSQKQSSVALATSDYLTLYLNNLNTKTLTEFRDDLLTNKGLAEATTEINSWYQTNK